MTGQPLMRVLGSGLWRMPRWISVPFAVAVMAMVMGAVVLLAGGHRAPVAPVPPPVSCAPFLCAGQ